MANAIVGCFEIWGPEDEIERIANLDSDEYFGVRTYTWRIDFREKHTSNDRYELEDCSYINIMVSFRAQLPTTIINMKDDFPNCAIEFDFQMEGCLGDWWKLDKFIDLIPGIKDKKVENRVFDETLVEGYINFSFQDNNYFSEFIRLLEYENTDCGINERCSICEKFDDCNIYDKEDFFDDYHSIDIYKFRNDHSLSWFLTRPSS